jgi:dipeptidyl aminopeptidase/acylaminoacyl peptidase
MKCNMDRDLRNSDLYREVEKLCLALRRPASGQICDAAEVHVAPDGKHAVLSGSLMDRLEGMPLWRICTIALDTGELKVLTFGPGTDRSPKFSPDGRCVAFLSDRHAIGDFQLYLLDLASGAALRTTSVDGWVEYLHWSPDGERILLGVAGFGADVAGGQGAKTTSARGLKALSWMPSVQSRDEAHCWRRAWVYELRCDRARQVSGPETNVWDATWCGNEALAVLMSAHPGEGYWYAAHVALIVAHSGDCRTLYTPRDQLGLHAASPSGEHLVIVESLCSDRGQVAGEARVIEIASGTLRTLNIHGVDVSHAEWRSDNLLLLAGHRGLQTVVGTYDMDGDVFAEAWADEAISTGGSYARVAGINSGGDCIIVGENFTRAPELAVIRSGQYCPLRSFDLGYAEYAEAIAQVEQVTWEAADGLEISGWLLLPKGRPPYPLVLAIHGGPVWHWRPVWLGRRAGAPYLMLVRRGYAVFFPNPRGSAGRGQDFIRRVYGDMGGADAQDLLAGLDALIERGIADPRRLGVTGMSYGGFMTSWLITQDARFAAAVSVSPHTNQVSQHLLSNIPQFTRLFLREAYYKAGGEYFKRSPIIHAHNVKTPTLNICGALDRCTPPEEAMQFHSALLENGTESALALYPEEGHGIRKYPAALDYTSRLVAWFEAHMPAREAG